MMALQVPRFESQWMVPGLETVRTDFSRFSLLVLTRKHWCWYWYPVRTAP